MRFLLNSSAQKKILIIKLSSLGDLFRPLPTVHLLKKHLDAEIDWVTQPEYVDLVDCFTDVRKVISFPRKNFLGNVSRYVTQVRKERYDYIIDLQGLMKSAVAARLARGAFRIGPSFQREGAWLFYNAVAGKKNKDRHSVEEMLDVIRYLQLPVDDIVFPVAFENHPLPSRAGPCVALLPCSRWPTKNWSPAHFSELGRQLLAAGVKTIYLPGGPSDRGACDEIVRGMGSTDGVFNLCGQTSFCELGGLLQQMDLVVGVDSGPLHMASAIGVPVVAMFGATDEVRTGPYGDRQRVVSVKDLPCRPCFSRECSRGDLACLERVTPEQVFGVCMEYLGSAGKSA